MHSSSLFLIFFHVHHYYQSEQWFAAFVMFTSLPLFSFISCIFSPFTLLHVQLPVRITGYWRTWTSLLVLSTWRWRTSASTLAVTCRISTTSVRVWYIICKKTLCHYIFSVVLVHGMCVSYRCEPSALLGPDKSDRGASVFTWTGCLQTGRVL